MAALPTNDRCSLDTDLSYLLPFFKVQHIAYWWPYRLMEICFVQWPQDTLSYDAGIIQIRSVVAEMQMFLDLNLFAEILDHGSQIGSQNYVSLKETNTHFPKTLESSKSGLWLMRYKSFRFKLLAAHWIVAPYRITESYFFRKFSGHPFQ